jgi:hypothetical protein
MEFDKRPVLGGLAALVAVAVVVGLVAGLAALVGTRVLGLDGDAEASSGGGGGAPTNGETLYLPRPSETEAPQDPLVTLQPGDEESSEEEAESEEDEEQEPEKDRERKQISLSAGQTSVSPMERIDLTGTYQGGEGAVLQVQRFEGGTWTDFPVTVSVSNATFATYVQTGQAGEVRFRVLDTDTEKASNPVTVSIG